MPDKSANSVPDAAAGRSSEDVQAVVSRVRSLSIFLVGVGIFAAIGLATTQAGLLSSYQMTYFAVGSAIGVVGLLLGLIAR